MQAHIFAEGSNTTADDRDRPIREYYQGLFSVVVGLHEELAAFADVHLHVLSEEYGVARGEQRLSTVYEDEQEPVGRDEMTERAKAELRSAASDADVIVILLSTDVFQETVSDVWNELVDAALPGSVWCLGATRSCLEELDVDRLEAKECLVLTYQRVGVARIGTETREELREAVRRKATR